MHTRRVAPFLLGAWLACSLLVGYLVIDTLHSPARLVNYAPSALKILEKLTPEETTLFVGFEATELARRLLGLWELVQLGIGATLLLTLVLGSNRKMVPIALCTLMIVAAIFEHFAIYPEFIFRGHEADFPPGSRTFNVQARLWAIEQIYLVVEAAKLLIGGILASYLFVFSGDSRRVRKRREIVGESVPQHRPVTNGVDS